MILLRPNEHEDRGSILIPSWSSSEVWKSSELFHVLIVELRKEHHVTCCWWSMCWVVVCWCHAIDLSWCPVPTHIWVEYSFHTGKYSSSGQTPYWVQIRVFPLAGLGVHRLPPQPHCTSACEVRLVEFSAVSVGIKGLPRSPEHRADPAWAPLLTDGPASGDRGSRVRIRITSVRDTPRSTLATWYGRPVRATFLNAGLPLFLQWAPLSLFS